MLKKLLIKVLIIVGALYAATIFFPENPVVKIIIDNYKNIFAQILEKIN